MYKIFCRALFVVFMCMLATMAFAGGNHTKPPSGGQINQLSTSQPEISGDKQEHALIGTVAYVACTGMLSGHVEHNYWTCAALGLLAMVAKEKTDTTFDSHDIAAGALGMGTGAAISYSLKF